MAHAVGTSEQVRSATSTMLTDDYVESGWISMLSEVTLVTCAVLVLLTFSSAHKHKKPAVKKVDKLGYELSDACKAITQPRRTSVKRTTVEDQHIAAERAKMNEIIFSSAKKGDLASAEAALARHETICRPSWEAYKVVITLCAKSDDPDRARQWLTTAREKGCYKITEPVCYNALINLYCKRKDMQQAVSVATEMLQSGVILDTVTYNTLIDGCARGGDPGGAEAWMNKMLEDGVHPSVVSFASVMRACACAGKAERVEYWLKAALGLGIELNMICFGAVINAFAKAGDIPTAYAWADKMIEHGVQGSVHCFTGILDHILKDKDMSQVDELKRIMLAANCRLDTGVYNSIVIAAVQAGDMERVQEWTDEAASLGLRLPKACRVAAKAIPGWTAPVPCEDVEAKGRTGSRKEVDQTPEVDWDQAKEMEGKRYVGTIKEYIACKFGYVVSEDVKAVFGRDVFLSSCDNPQGFAKGQRVEFTLQIDKRRNLPRASDLTAHSLPKIP